MHSTCVVGLQWGDEAKGKIVDILGANHDIVVRYNGGNNAGHTIVHGDKTFKVSILPTGILKPHLQAVIGNGVVIYPPQLLKEIEQLKESGISVTNRLLISDHAHVIFPYHIIEDKLTETEKSGAIGTTGRGIGPCYQDKAGRVHGIRVGELLYPQHLKARLAKIIAYKNAIFQTFTPEGATPQQLHLEAVYDEYRKYGEAIKPYVTDSVQYLHQSLQDKKRLLFEAAQGSLLDLDHGTFPYVTSSSSLPSGIWPGTGVPAKMLGKIIGVLKAYTTRVGNGPFPTELDDGPTGIGERIRQKGREFGTVTGRPRRCGWFDAVACRYTAAIAGADELAVMLLDVLSGLEEIKICVGYELDGAVRRSFISDAHILENCKPKYEVMEGWKEEITHVKKLNDLPAQAQRYIQRISELVGLPVKTISVGPDRDQTIIID
ncbi:MAG: adenylosuccinate synthase [Zavarzinella sp.]